MAQCSLLGSAASDMFRLNNVSGVATVATSAQPKLTLCDIGLAKPDKLPVMSQMEKRKLAAFHQKRMLLSTITRGMPPEASTSGPMSSSQAPRSPSPPSRQPPVDIAESPVANAVAVASAPQASPASIDAINPLDFADSAQQAARGQDATRRSDTYPLADNSHSSRENQDAVSETTESTEAAAFLSSPRSVWTALLESPAAEVAGRSDLTDGEVGRPEAVWSALLAAVSKATKEEMVEVTAEETTAERSLSPANEQNVEASSSMIVVERLPSEGLKREESREAGQAASNAMREGRVSPPMATSPKGVVLPVIPDVKASTAVAPAAAPAKDVSTREKKPSPSRIRKVNSQEQLDRVLKLAGESLVVLQYVGKDSKRCKALYLEVINLSRNHTDIIFLLVVGDESEATVQLCKNQGVRRPPHFTFFRSERRIHDMLVQDIEEVRASILYYTDKFAPLVQQLGSVEAWEALVAENKGSDKLAVVDISMHQCGPCVRVYPTLINLSRKMSDIATFARVVGDENDSTRELLRRLNIIEVPTFIFLRNGEMLGRYVGSGKGELVGEILRYQGVRITY